MTSSNESLRSVLESQYHAALAMLEEAIRQCPDDLWIDGRHWHVCWQLAYHAFFITHPDRLRAAADVGVRWVGGRSTRAQVPGSGRQA